MDTDKYRSTNVPIGVTVESDRETVAGDGEYSATDGGFVLTFSTGDGKYEITHTESDTTLAVSGLLAYKISFASNDTVSVESPFGSVKISISPISRSVEKSDGAIRIALKYGMTAEGCTDAIRDVTITARFK